MKRTASKTASAGAANKRPGKTTKTPAGKANGAPAAPVPAASPTPAAPSRDAKASKAAEAEGKSKQKLVRDSFTIPKHEYAMLADLKQRAIRLQHPVKKSELLRAGIAALQAMSDAALLAVLQAVPSLKTGRPKDSGKR